MKIIIPNDGVNEIPDGYKPLFTEDGKFVAIIPKNTRKGDFYWLSAKNATPFIDWEQRRYELAKTAMVELMNYDYYSDDRQHPEQRNSGLLTNMSSVCHCAVSYADKLIQVLKEKPQND
jgi:hypothetical protein